MIAGNIHKICQEQEDKFLEDYKKQMYEAQRNLRDFTQNVIGAFNELMSKE